MTLFRLALLAIFLTLSLCVNGQHIEKVHYELTGDPIDAVIVAHRKDQETIDDCIKGIRKYCANIRRVIVVSKEKLTDNAEWFHERLFPFSLDDVYVQIGQGDRNYSKEFFSNHNRGPGWYLQQLLKLYSAFVIPGISPNVLVVDSDIVFLNPVHFLNEENGGLLCFCHKKGHKRYMEHAGRVLPNYQRIYPEIYSVCHHMLFQRAILEDLFHTVEQHHNNVPFWKVFCTKVEPHPRKGASEYEIYFNFALRHTDQVELRELRWRDSSELGTQKKYKKQGYHFVGFHTYLRK